PQLCFFRVIDASVLNARYLAYWFKSADFIHQVTERAHNTDMAAYVNLRDIRSLRLRIPRPTEQQAIAEVLGALDDKIAANNSLIGTLANLATAIFEAALGADWRVKPLRELAKFHNHRRIPLSSRQRAERHGVVPYYGAAGQVDFVDTPLFDENLVLVGEDGSVIRSDGRAVVQYIWGPSWVNNHAHVLTGKGISTELLRVTIERQNVAHLITGAVQPKISMGKLKTLTLQVPTEADLSKLDAKIQSFAAGARVITDENKTLARTRDDLLPLLMSGKVRVREAEKVVEQVL
ncbi:MAG: restriction endonuclease subunit S, partial [Pseudonocardiaceae bacterium]